eukprot:7321420-Prymnesium_polylepis.1
MKALNDLLYDWADIALRTLVWGRRAIADADYDSWRKKYEAANAQPEEILKLKQAKPNAITRLQVARLIALMIA